MLVHRRFLPVALVAGLAFLFYCFSSWASTEPPSGRTLFGRTLGMLGWATSLVTCASYAWQRRRSYPQEEQDTWHASLGGLAIWLLLLHSGFRFGNVVAGLAFLAVFGGIASGMAIRIYDRKLVQLAAQTDDTDHVRATTRRYNRLRLRWLTVHIAAVSGLLTFTCVHILSVLYY
jgi:hypothetical protein